MPRDPSALFLTPFSPSPSVGKESLLSCQSSPHLSHNNSFNLGTLSRRESKGMSRQQSIRSGDLEYRIEDGEEYDHGLIQPTVPPMTLPLRPYLDSAVGGIELEILNLIAKVRYNSVWYTALYYSILFYTTLHHTTLHHIMLHCNSLHYNTIRYSVEQCGIES